MSIQCSRFSESAVICYETWNFCGLYELLCLPLMMRFNFNYHTTWKEGYRLRSFSAAFLDNLSTVYERLARNFFRASSECEDLRCCLTSSIVSYKQLHKIRGTNPFPMQRSILSLVTDVRFQRLYTGKILANTLTTKSVIVGPWDTISTDKQLWRQKLPKSKLSENRHYHIVDKIVNSV